MQEQPPKWAEYSVKITKALSELFNPDNPNHIDLEELKKDNNTTEFFHALANAVPTRLYNQITGSDENLIEFNHVANILCFQFVKIDKRDEKTT